MGDINKTSLDTLAGALCKIMGVEAPVCSNGANADVTEYASRVFGGESADRIFMYNPDAVAQWICEKYPTLIREVTAITELEECYCTVMPSITPVCFGTMYTGAQPEVHGIRKYEKPVIKIDTVFDALLRAGKRVAIVATPKCSIANIFLERELDYFICENINEVNATACELIIEDKHDFIVVYNGNYDAVMHKNGPESLAALSELRANSQAFAVFDSLIRKHWRSHNVFEAFAMDHGCHEIDGDCGSHGLDMPEDLNIKHYYKAYNKGE